MANTNKQKGKRGFKRVFSLLLVLGVLFFFSYQYYRQEQALAAQAVQMQQLQKKKAAIDKALADKSLEVKDKGSDQFIERYLRDKLGMVKQGEILFSNK